MNSIRTSTTLMLAAPLLLIVACSRSQSEPPGVSAEAESQNAGSPVADQRDVAIDPRSQYDLAADIRRAELESSEDERSYAYSELGQEWRGKRYRWTVNYLPAFCPNETRCHVVPFDRGGKDKAIVQGWSPQLNLSAAEWAKIPLACPADGPRCTLTFEGTLASFRISTEELTSLRFSDVQLVTIAPQAS